jgi:hypothetical protein
MDSKKTNISRNISVLATWERTASEVFPCHDVCPLWLAAINYLLFGPAFEFVNMLVTGGQV